MLNLISEIFLLLQCAAAGSARTLEQADHALAQVRPRQIFTKQPLNNRHIRNQFSFSLHYFYKSLCFRISGFGFSFSSVSEIWEISNTTLFFIMNFYIQCISHGQARIMKLRN